MNPPQKIKLNFDLNNGCNLRCLMCGGRTNPADQTVIPLELFREKLLPLFNRVTEFQFGCQCEPLLHPDFDKIAYLIGSRITAEVNGSCVSNGTLLSEKNRAALLNSRAFRKLRFSWDASNRQLFEKIRIGAHFDAMLKNIQELITLRDAEHPDISIEFITTVLPENHADLPDIVRLAADLGVNSVFTHKLYPDDYKWVSDDYCLTLHRVMAEASQIAEERGVRFKGENYRTEEHYARHLAEQQVGNTTRTCSFLGNAPLTLILDAAGNVSLPCRKLSQPLANILTDSLQSMLEMGMADLLPAFFKKPEDCCLTCHLFTEQQETSMNSDTTRTAQLASVHDHLPIHFFTIVLNGEPFIRHHIEMFKQLPLNWHWHVIEGVARQVHDTSWCANNGGSITGELHANGISNDGTTEYLDQLAAQYPEQVTIYRKPAGQFWDGKLEMVNAPLATIGNTCLLWQIDSDECWNSTQIINLHQLFSNAPSKTSARFICNFYVGPGLVISSINTYGNNTHYEWYRCWRYEPGDQWLSHSPPVLGRLQKSSDRWIDVGSIDPIMHLETSKHGLIFDHYAYATKKQVAFKEVYYGYAAAVDNWHKLQKATDFPVLLRDYFPWVHDHAKVERGPLGTILPNHIVYLRTDAIGDNILSAGILPHLKNRYPGALITVVCQDRVAPLYDTCPFVDGVVSFNYIRLMTQPVYRRLILDKMNNLQPTLLVNPIYSHDLHDEFLVHHCHALLKIACQGDTSNRSREKLDSVSDLYSLVISNNPDDRTELDHHRTFLAGIGIQASNLAPMVWSSPEQEQWADELLARHGIPEGSAIMLFPGSLLDYKTYPHYAEVVQHLKDFPLIILGGDELLERGNSLCAAHSGKSVNLAGQTALGQMAALMRRGRLYLGSDSAGMHIACAVGLRNVVLLGGGHFGRFCPYSALTTAVCLPLSCYHCNWHCPYPRVHCLHDISPETVLQAVAYSLTDTTGRSEPAIFSQQGVSAMEGPMFMPGMLKGYFQPTGKA